MALTSVIRTVRALDSTSTAGAGKTGLAFSDITAKYRVDGGTLTSLTPETITTLGTYQAPTDATHIRIKEISSSDPCKGELEIHFHNTQLATGNKLWLSLSASGAVFQPLEVDLSNIAGRLPAALTANGNIKASLVEILTTALTETVGGYLAAAFKKLLDVATPVLTAASVNQTGDAYGRIGAAGAGLTALGDTRIAYLDAAISSLNNLSALANLYGSPLLEIPDSSTTQFAYTLVVRDNEGKLVELDGSPTITAANAAGTDRSSNLSAVSHPATGRYTFTYGVTSAAAEESLRITCSGTVSAEARYIEWIGAVVNYDSLTSIAAIKAQTDLIPASPAAVGSAMTLTSGERNSVADALLDRSAGIETSVTFRQGMRLVLAMLQGKMSKNGDVYSFRDYADSKDRVVMTTNSDNERTAVTRDAT